MHGLAAAHDAAVQMIDTSIVRVHQHAACIAGNKGQSMGRSRGGLTSKIHAVVDTNGLPVRLGLTAGEARLPVTGAAVHGPRADVGCLAASSVWTAVRAIANCGWSRYAALTV